MTTYFDATIRCAVCDAEQVISMLGSSSGFGAPDLDGRPAGRVRSTMGSWVQRCTGCGYCAPDITAEQAPPRAWVEAATYRAQLEAPDAPALANTFLCASALAEQSGDLAWAFQHALRAAWCADDARLTVLACQNRSRALEMLSLAAKADAETLGEGVPTAMKVDLLRRCGRFAQARSVIETERCDAYPEAIQRILDYQSTLIEAEDSSAHAMSDIEQAR